jgi:hypothetical protein
MKSDILLHWMSHVGGGAWAGFRSAIANLASEDADLQRLCRSLRIWLSDLGHADFFVGGSQRWRALPPVLAGLSTVPNAAILVGSQTPTLIGLLTDAASARGCAVATEFSRDYPTTIRMTGPENALSEVSAATGVPYLPNLHEILAGQLTPVGELLRASRMEAAPHNWTAKSFDFESMTWIEGVRRRSACEFSSRYGVRRYYVQLRRGSFFPMPRREAVYAAATHQRVALMQYDPMARVLRAPVAAPPPELYSRTASLCAGAQGRVQDAYITYEGVPPATAAILCVAAGQPHPTTKITSVSAASRGSPNG